MDIAPEHQKERCLNGKRALRSLTTQGSRTTTRLELEFWNAMDDACQREGISKDELIERAEKRLRHASRTSAVRVYIVNYFRKKVFESGATLMSDEVHDKD